MVRPNPPARLALPDPASVNFADPASIEAHLTALNTAITRLHEQLVVRPSAGVMLISPNKSVYEQRVSDAGVVSVHPLNVTP